MEFNLWNKIKNYFLTIKNIKGEIKVPFKYRNRIVFLLKNQIYIYFLVENLNQVVFNKKVLKMKQLKVENESPNLKEKEEKIKEWLKTILKEKWSFLTEKFFNKLNTINIFCDLETYEWVIDNMELGNLGNFLIVLNEEFEKKDFFNNEMEKLCSIFNKEKIKSKFCVFIEWFWIFAVLRNTTYHYSVLDQVLMRGSLKLLDHIISQEEPLKKKKEKFFTFKIVEEKHKFSLKYENIDFFEKTFNILKEFIDF